MDNNHAVIVNIQAELLKPRILRERYPVADASAIASIVTSDLMLFRHKARKTCNLYQKRNAAITQEDSGSFR